MQMTYRGTWKRTNQAPTDVPIRYPRRGDHTQDLIDKRIAVNAIGEAMCRVAELRSPFATQ
jgi:hypothetical protein